MMDEQPDQLGPIETKRYREKRVNECLTEVRRAIHDGEWPLALQGAAELVDRLVPLAKVNDD